MSPTRCCIVCKQRKPKEQLIRIVTNGYDEEQKKNARGIYLCRDKSCLQRAQIQLMKNKLTVKIPINKESLMEIIKKVESELGE